MTSDLSTVTGNTRDNCEAPASEYSFDTTCSIGFSRASPTLASLSSLESLPYCTNGTIRLNQAPANGAVLDGARKRKEEVKAYSTMKDEFDSAQEPLLLPSLRLSSSYVERQLLPLLNKKTIHQLCLKGRCVSSASYLRRVGSYSVLENQKDSCHYAPNSVLRSQSTPSCLHIPTRLIQPKPKRCVPSSLLPKTTQLSSVPSYNLAGHEQPRCGNKSCFDLPCKFDLRCLQFKQQLSVGHSSVVVLAALPDSSLVVVKAFLHLKRPDRGQHAYCDFENEYNSLVKCNEAHLPGVVRIVGWGEEARQHALLLEYLSAGCLTEWVNSDAHYPMSPHLVSPTNMALESTFLRTQRCRLELFMRISWAFQIAVIVADLHRINIVHSDIKPDNIMFRTPPSIWKDKSQRLVVYPGQCVLLDFTFARRPSLEKGCRPEGASGVCSQPRCFAAQKKNYGSTPYCRLLSSAELRLEELSFWPFLPSTPAYAAPEQLFSNETSLSVGGGFLVDIWSIGCILRQLFCREETVFQGVTRRDIISQINQGCLVPGTICDWLLKNVHDYERLIGCGQKRSRSDAHLYSDQQGWSEQQASHLKNQLIQITSNCLQLDPAKRLTAEELKQDLASVVEAAKRFYTDCNFITSPL